MKVRRLLMVGLLLSLLVSPLTWADTTAGDEEGFWGIDWLQNLVSWAQSIIEGPDPIPQNPLELEDPQQEVQSIPNEQDRDGAIDPSGVK